MPDLETVISNSISDLSPTDGDTADSGGDAPEIVTETDTGELSTETDTASEPASESGTTQDSTVEASADAKPAESKRKRWMPLDAHEKTLNNARAESQRVVSELNGRLERLKWAEDPGVQDKLQALDIADTNPQVFFEALLQDPRYAKIAADRFGRQADAQPPAAASVPQAATDRPKPDVLLSDGSYTYSDEGLQKLLDWQADRTSKQVLDRVTDQYDKRFGPIEKVFRTAEERQTALAKQGSILDRARREWPSFKEHESAIAAYIADKTKARQVTSLDDAWRAVVYPKLQATRDSMRAELLAEINGKKTAGVKPPKASNGAVSTGPRKLEDVIKASIAGLS